MAGPPPGGRAGATLAEAEGSDGARGEKAVRVTAVRADAPAFQYGLRPGDVIVGVNRNRVRSVAELAKALRAHGRHALNVVRGDFLLTIVVR